MKNALIEIHHFIGIIKCYHRLLRQVYSIIITEILSIQSNLALQMSFKAINNLIGLNKLVSTLLVFNTYLKMTEQKVLFLLVIKCVTVMRKTIDEIKKNIVSHSVNNILNTYNRSFTGSVYDLSISLSVLVY